MGVNRKLLPLPLPRDKSQEGPPLGFTAHVLGHGGLSWGSGNGLYCDLAAGYLSVYVGPIHPVVQLRYLHFTACMLYLISLNLKM